MYLWLVILYDKYTFVIFSDNSSHYYHRLCLMSHISFENVNTITVIYCSLTECYMKSCQVLHRTTLEVLPATSWIAVACTCALFSSSRITFVKNKTVNTLSFMEPLIHCFYSVDKSIMNSREIIPWSIRAQRTNQYATELWRQSQTNCAANSITRDQFNTKWQGLIQFQIDSYPYLIKYSKHQVEWWNMFQHQVRGSLCGMASWSQLGETCWTLWLLVNGCYVGLC